MAPEKSMTLTTETLTADGSKVVVEFQRTLVASTGELLSGSQFAGIAEPNTTSILSHAIGSEEAEGRAFAAAVRERYQHAVAAAEGLTQF
jgi:hypothetical protein